MMTQRQPLSRQAGLTLIEASIALALFGTLIALAVGIGGGLLASTDVQGEQARLNAIQKSVDDLYQGRSNYTGLDNSTALSAGVYPENMVSNSTALNAWNGEVTTAAANDTDGNSDRAFEVVWGSVAEDACTNLATGTGADQVSISGSVVTDSTGQVNPADAATQCSGGTSDVEFLFEK